MTNGGELTYLDYLPTKQRMQNISGSWTHRPLVSSGPSSDTRVDSNKPKIIIKSAELIEMHYRLMVSIWYPLHLF
jgi:hypothetical protein